MIELIFVCVAWVVLVFAFTMHNRQIPYDDENTSEEYDCNNDEWRF